MRDFELASVKSVAEAEYFLSTIDKDKKVVIYAGGTDVLGGLKRDIYPNDMYPDYLLHIGDTEELSYIKEEDGFLKIGACTKLVDIAESELLNRKYTAIAEAARHTASPLIRNTGTIGGNICQENRCWYYRSDENYFHCRMKGGKMCYAAAGDNRYHSVFGACNGCFAVNPSDMAPALYAFGAKMLTNKRVILPEEFWTQNKGTCNVLEAYEILLEIRIPLVDEGVKSKFLKIANRKTIDFPIINCAVVTGEKASVVLNAVAPVPHPAEAATALIAGKEITAELAAEAGQAAVEGAKALKGNAYKIEQIKVIVKRALEACM